VKLWVLIRPGIKEGQQGKIHCRVPHPLERGEDDSPYLFISTRGIPLERRSYWDLMQKYGKVAAIPKPKRRFHTLRHAIAVHLLDAGADVAFVQVRLGHANIQKLRTTGHVFASGSASTACAGGRSVESTLRW
jgi:site-specific recombinase XerD